MAQIRKNDDFIFKNIEKVRGRRKKIHLSIKNQEGIGVVVKKESKPFLIQQ